MMYIGSQLFSSHVKNTYWAWAAKSIWTSGGAKAGDSTKCKLGSLQIQQKKQTLAKMQYAQFPCKTKSAELAICGIYPASFLAR